MPEYLSPGVYVEEIDSGPKPIEGVSTSTAGAVGVTERGPSDGKPILVTSYADFVRKFGPPLAEPDPGAKAAWGGKADGGEWWRFALSVKGFFDNGGQRLFVRRVTAANAKASSQQLTEGLFLDIEKSAKAADTSLVIGRASGTIGLDTSAANNAVVLKKLDGTVSQALTVKSYDGSRVEFTGAIGNDVTPGLWTLQVRAPAANNTFQIVAYSVGKWGDGIQARLRPMASATLSMLPNPGLGGAGASTKLSAKTASGNNRIVVDSLTGFANNDKADILGVQYTLTGFGVQATLAAATAAPTPAGNVDVLGPANLTTLAAPLAAAGTQIQVQAAAAAQLAANDVVVIEPAGATPFRVTLGAFTAPDLFAVPAGNTAAAGDKVYKVASTTTTTGAAAGTSLPLATAPAANDKLFITPAAVVTVQSVQGTATIAPNATAELPAGATVRKLLGAVNPAANTVVYLSNASRLYENALLEFDNGKEKEFVTVKARVGQKVELFNGLTKTYADTDVARLIEGRLEVRYQRSQAEPAITETFEAVRLRDDSSPQYIVNRVREGSSLIRIVNVTPAWNTAQPDLARFPSFGIGEWITLGGGDDDLGSLTNDNFIGIDLGPGRRSGITSLEDIDEISICLAPGMWATDVRRALIEHCELLKDRFAVVDPTPALLLNDSERIDPEVIKAKIDSKYGAVYYPWLIGRDFAAGRNVRLPPSGHVAGIYARSDVERGVHKAPANEVVRAIDSFEIDIAKREQDMLNPKGVNALRYFPNRGNRVWGARCLTSDMAWKYVNVRRLFIFVEESIDEGTQWVVFEPNDEKLWARVRQTINQFLERLWREGMLFGAKREEAFFVKCDRTTMTQDDIDNGRLICVIGIAPVKPAEFVIFRIQQKTLEQQS